MLSTQEIVLRPSVCYCSPCSQPRWERGNEAGVIGGPTAVANMALSLWEQMRSNPEHYSLESALTCYSVCRNGNRGKQDGQDRPALAQRTVRTAELPGFELYRATSMWICHC